MKLLFNTFSKLAAVAAVALSISSCNRAEYAMLPKTTSYHGTERVAARPNSQPASVNENVATPEIESPAVASAPVVAAAPAVVAPAAPEAAAPTSKAIAPKASKSTATTRKAPTFLQHALVKKVTKRADKIASKMLVKKNQETASTEQANAISGNLRTGIILLLVGLLIGIIPGDIFSLIGGIVAIIGIVFIILWLLDNL